MIRLMALVFAVVTLTAPAVGQGVDRHFAEPMSWATLRDRLDRLSPAEAQWTDLQAAHDTYLLEMNELRTGRIARWLDAHGMIDLKLVGNPDDVEDANREKAVIRGQLSSIDDDFFARAAGVLGDDQQTALERLRLRRERDRLHLGHHLSSGVLLELADHIDPTLLTPEIRRVLFDWEDRRTDLLKQVMAARSQQQEKMAEVMALVLEIQDASSDLEARTRSVDHQGRALIQEEVSAGMLEVREQAQAVQGQVRTHAWQGTRALAELLPTEEAHRLRLASISSLGIHVAEQHQNQLRRSGLTAEDPEVSALLEAYRNDMAPLANAAAAKANSLPEPWSIAFSMVQGEADPWQIHHDGIVAAAKPMNDRATRLAEDLGRLVGTEIAADTSGRKPSAGESPFSTSSSASIVIMATDDSPAGADGGVVMSTTFELDGDDLGMGAGMNMASMLGYTPLPSHLRDRLTRDLSLNADGLSTLDRAMAKHAELLLAEQTKAMESLQSGHGGAQMLIAGIGSPSNSKATVEQADAEFFEAIEQLGDPVAVEPHRLARVRARATGGGGMSMMISFGGSGSSAHKADPTEALEQAGLADDQITANLRALGNWHASATAAAENLGDAQRRQSEALMAMSQIHFGESSEVATSTTDSPSTETGLTEVTGRTSAAQQKLGALYQDGLEQILANLSEADGVLVRRQWLHDAYSGVIGWGDPLGKSFRSAFKVNDLSDAQRAAIMQLQMEHEEAWWTDSEAIIATMPDGGSMADLIGGSGDDMENSMAAIQRANQELERQNFVRREASLKRLVTLRDLLTEQQLQQADGLPDPQQPRGGMQFGF